MGLLRIRWLALGTLLFSLVGGCAHVPRSAPPAELVRAIEADFELALRKELEARKPGARVELVEVLKTESRPNGDLKLRYRFAYAKDEADGESVTVEQESEATLSPRDETWEVTTVLPQGQTLAFTRGLLVESPRK
jgi:hypothetical protein